MWYIVSYSIVKGQHLRMNFGHRICKKCGVEVEEGTEMRSVKSVMEHCRRSDRYVGDGPLLDLYVRRLIIH